MKLDPHQLAALTAVLRRGSFESAAADLSVTPSAVSQRIKALEERIGGSLVLRGTPCTGTAAGIRVVKHAEDMNLLETQLSRELELDVTTGPSHLRIAVNADSLATWFIRAMSNDDSMLFELVLDDEDHSIQWLQRGEVSIAISAQEKPATGCDAWPLGELRYVPTASADFIARWFADGVTAQSLARAPCLTFNAKDMMQRRWMAETFGTRVSPPSHYLPSTYAFVDAARAGLGWGMNPEQLVRKYLDDGSLKLLVKEAPLEIPLTLQVSRIMAPALAPVIRKIRAAAAKGLD